MTLSFLTARAKTKRPTKYAARGQAPLVFPVQAWDVFATVVTSVTPAVAALMKRPIATLMARQRGERVTLPEHPTEDLNGQPLVLMWTDEECRQLFVALSGHAHDRHEKAHDFWAFMALLCGGISEEGVCVE